MRLHHLASSSIAAIGYDRRKQVLVVQFLHGGTYAYFDVPRDQFDAFRDASSAGRHFTRRIRGRFPYVQLTAWPAETRRPQAAPATGRRRR